MTTAERMEYLIGIAGGIDKKKLSTEQVKIIADASRALREAAAMYLEACINELEMILEEAQ